MAVSDATRLKALQEENARLKRLLAEAMLALVTQSPDIGIGADRHLGGAP